MTPSKTDIFVYAHWKGMSDPRLIGILTAQDIKGKKVFSFAYQGSWLDSKHQVFLDPDLSGYKGVQYPDSKGNFGFIADSMPDTWGRTLMKRRASELYKKEGKVLRNLNETDFLLGVNDETRMGALRFKLDPDGPFLDNNSEFPTPPWAGIRELQYSAELLESEKDNAEVRKWLRILMAPGSSLGGARPKANILDLKNHLWIAKFPSKNDTVDKAAWEYLAYKLAINAKVVMSECKIEKIIGSYHTFFTKRFDREGKERIHFASAMTMTGNSEDTIRDRSASYLDIAEVIQYSGTNVKEDLNQLWRRIVFNIAISNTDDHLRNHGFVLNKEGWHLSPAFDINPSIEKDGLALNIDMDENALDFELAKSVGTYFQLKGKQMETIIDEVVSSVKQWDKIALKIGISRAERSLMASAFRIM